MDIHWAQIMFTVLAALSAGVLAITAGTALLGMGGKVQLPGATISVASLLLGGIASLAYLGHPERAFGVFANLRSSVTEGAIALVGALLIAVAYLVKVKRKSEIGKILPVISILFPVGMMEALSRFYYMPDRPVWIGILLFFTCLVLAGLLGTSTVYLLARFLNDSLRVRRVCGWGALLTFVIGAALIFGSFKVLNPQPGGGNGHGESPGFAEQSSPGGGQQSSPSHNETGGNGSDGSGVGETPSFLEQH